MGWSAEGVKFYQDVWKKWETIPSVNALNVWKKLEEGWEEFDKENRFGCISYSRAKIPSHNVNTKTAVCDNQERCLQANGFSLDGEENFESDKPWTKKGHCLATVKMAVKMKKARTDIQARKQGGQGECLS